MTMIDDNDDDDWWWWYIFSLIRNETMFLFLS
jgi:hypothetical protein